MEKQSVKCFIVISELSRLKFQEVITIERFNLTAKAACAFAQVSAPTLRKWTKEPGFPIIRVGKKILIPEVAFRSWLLEKAGVVDGERLTRRNPLGYDDPTPFYALNNVEKERKKQAGGDRY